MRILHTSDWHLGRVLYKVPRAADHDVVLAEILTVAREERPDLIIHSGDLFDHAHPGLSDLERAITVLRELGSIAPVVVVRGNHDTEQLFRFLTLVLGADSRVHLVDRPLHPQHGGVLLFPLPDGTTARLAVLPFVHENRAVEAFEDPRTWRKAYTERVSAIERELAAELERDFDPRREIALFAAHLHIGGVDFAGSERRAHACEYYETSTDALPTTVSYAAFGHIHKPQELPSAKVTGRYAGSPLQLDFGEAGERKSVVLVDVEPDSPAVIRTIALSGGRQLRKFDGTLDDLRALAPSIGNDLCHITMHTPTHVPGLYDQVRDLLPEAVLVEFLPVCADRRLEMVTGDPTTHDADLDLSELFREYLATTGTLSAPAEQVHQLFTTVLTAIENDDDLVLSVESALAEPLPGDEAVA